MGREARRNRAAHGTAPRPPRDPTPDVVGTTHFIPWNVVQAARAQNKLPLFEFSDRVYAVMPDGSLRRRPQGQTSVLADVHRLADALGHPRDPKP